MTEEKIIELLTRLGCRRIRTRGDNVSATCPEEAVHRGGRDRNPSYGVLINPDGVSPSNCRACGFSDSAEWMARTHGWSDLAGNFRTTVDGDNYIHIPKDNRGVFAVPESDPLLPPESSIKPFVGVVPQYILSRGFTLETCKVWEMGYDRVNSRATFTIRDRLGRLRGLSGRTVTNSKIKYLHYVWDHRNKRWSHGYDYDRYGDFEKWRKKMLLLGEHMVDWERVGPERRCIIIVEGHTDAVWLWQIGWTGMAVMGSSMSPQQADTVVRLLPPDGFVVTMADGDEGGKALAKSVREFLVGRVPLYESELPYGLDPQGQSDEVIQMWMSQRKLAMAA